MQMLNSCERQTVIQFASTDNVVKIVTCSPTIQEKLTALCKQYPSDYYFAGTYHHGNSPMIFFIPQKDYRGIVG